jgi:hypothetical protein
MELAGRASRAFTATLLLVLALLQAPLWAAEGGAPPEIAAKREAIAGDFMVTIAKCVRRHDTGHPIFHGCIDWHSAVHGHWALVAVARVTGDKKLLDAVTVRLDEALVAEERRLLAADPDFEMPYGRAWFLRLAGEYERATGDLRLRPMADDLATSLVTYFAGHRFDPMIGSYESETWALINLRAYGVSRGNAEVAAFVDDRVAAALRSGVGRCPFDEDALQHSFMAICTNWAWLVGVSVGGEAGSRAVQAILPPDTTMKPVVFPASSHLYGLDFSRAWGLWRLWRRTGEEAYLRAFATHFILAAENRDWWDGDYRAVGHWVAQFGVMALMPLFEPDYQ